jgi:hypothetical protein
MVETEAVPPIPAPQQTAIRQHAASGDRRGFDHKWGYAKAKETLYNQQQRQTREVTP